MTNAFLSAPPEVKLVNAFSRPFDNAVATARTCYSGKGIVFAEEVAGDSAPDDKIRAEKLKKRDDLAAALYDAGHHTVFQHAHFQFALANVSRQFVWSFLHSHPFYNSEQVSQRYVEVKPKTTAVPPLQGESLAIYNTTVEKQFDAYRKLTDMLTPLVADAYFFRFKARRSKSEKYENDIKKKALELARYVLPVATFTYLYHTVSGITLMRYWRLCNEPDTPLEQRIVVGKMVAELLKFSPEYEKILRQPREFCDEIPKFSPQPREFCDEFDATLGNRVSKLVASKPENEKILADAVREVLGLTKNSMSDDDAIELVLNPAKNRLLGDALNLTTMSKLSRAMVHPSYTFRKKLSHTADSQDQRHRTTPASRPILHAQVSDEPDFVAPELIKWDEKVAKFFTEMMEMTWDGITKLQKFGVSAEFCAYLLPNAVAIRFTESGDLMSLWHKHAMRLCYNAQEEIWRASLDEAEQIREVNPRIGKWLLPPCGHRLHAHATPICPEGVRYCGVPVWKLDISQYERAI
jgi:thymidylate synthase ThyX